MIIMKKPYCYICENKMVPFSIKTTKRVEDFEYCSKCGIVRKVLP